MTSADRFTRFGQAYLEMLFTGFGVTFTVLDPDEEQTPEQELTEDLPDRGDSPPHACTRMKAALP